MKRCKGIPWLFLLAAIPLAAAEVEFSARVDFSKIGLDDHLSLTLTLSGVDNPSEPQLGTLSDFTVVGRSRGTEVRLMNGRASYLTRFEYQLAPQRIGTLRIPAFTHVHEGRTLRTSPIEVEVVAGSIAPTPRQRSLFPDDFFSSPLSRARKPEAVDVNMEVRVSDRAVVTGQQVMIQVLLLTRNRVQAVNLLSEPSIPGFWQEWFPVPRSIAGEDLELEGKNYTAYPVRRVALFPSQSGTLTIPALRFEVMLGDDGFGFFAAPRRITRSTLPVTIEVTDPPAPALGLPVGNFSFALEPLPGSVGINDMLTLKMKITGDGNMKTLTVPELESGPFHQVFPPRIARTLDYSENRLRGTVSVEIPVSFRKGGDISLPAFDFRWYDPRTKQVVTAESPVMRVRVTGEKSARAASAPASNAEVVRRGEDIRYIQSGEIFDQSRHWYGSRLFTWLILLPFAISLVVFLYGTLWAPWIRRNHHLQARRLLAATLRELKALQGLSGAAAILEAYLHRRVGLPPSSLNASSIASVLEKRGVPERQIREFMAFKQKADSLKFSPETSDTGGVEEIGRLVELLRSMDRRIS